MCEGRQFLIVGDGLKTGLITGMVHVHVVNFRVTIGLILYNMHTLRPD
jgi:hypothetical protein